MKMAPFLPTLGSFFAVLNQDVTSAGRFHFGASGGRHLHKRQPARRRLPVPTGAVVRRRKQLLFQAC